MWISLTLLCALSLSVSDVFAKLAVRRFDSAQVAWARFALAAPLTFFLVFHPACRFPDNWPVYLFYMALALPLEIVATFLYIKALEKSPLSLTVPFLAFTPVCILLTGWIILEERPTLEGASGVVLVAFGAYVLSSGGASRGLFAPIKNFIREPGSVMMLGVAVLYSLTATLGKKLIQLSSPLFLLSTYGIFVALAMTLLVFRHRPLEKIRPLVKSGLVWGVGGFWALMAVFHVFAITMSHASYMVAVKRTSLLFGVVFGLALFKEGGARHRIPGSLVMLAGVLLLALVSKS